MIQMYPKETEWQKNVVQEWVVAVTQRVSILISIAPIPAEGFVLQVTYSRLD